MDNPLLSSSLFSPLCALCVSVVFFQANVTLSPLSRSPAATITAAATTTAPLGFALLLLVRFQTGDGAEVVADA